MWDKIKACVIAAIEIYGNASDASVRNTISFIKDWPETLPAVISVDDIYGKYYGHPDIFTWYVTPLDLVLSVITTSGAGVVRLGRFLADLGLSAAISKVFGTVAKQVTGADDVVSIQGQDDPLRGLFYLSYGKLGRNSVIETIAGKEVVRRG